MEVLALKSFVAVKSLFLQLASLTLTFLFLSALSNAFLISFSVVSLLICHATFAAITAFLLRFDWWWIPIQFCFPLLAYFLLQLSVAPSVYLIVLVIFSALYWSTYRTQVPYYPSRSELIEPISKLIPLTTGATFVDVGSGMGGLLIKLAKRRHDAFFYGVEIAPLPWLISVIRARVANSHVEFQFGDFYSLDLSKFDVVFCYLSPAAMPSIWDKARAEMRSGTLFLSYEFIVPSATPDFSIEIENGSKYLYGWRI